MKNKFKKITAFICSAVLLTLSTITAFADYDMTRYECICYVFNQGDSVNIVNYTNSLSWDGTNPESLMNNYADSGGNIPAFLLSSSDTIADLEVASECIWWTIRDYLVSDDLPLENIGYQYIFIYDPDTATFRIGSFLFDKTEDSYFRVTTSGQAKYITYNGLCMYYELRYTYNSDSDCFEYSSMRGENHKLVDSSGSGSTSGIFYGTGNGQLLYSFGYSKVLDDDGNEMNTLYTNDVQIDISYDFSNGYHNFTVSADKMIALSFDFCEYDSSYKYNFGTSPVEGLTYGKPFDITDFNPIFRYNQAYGVGDLSDTQSYTFYDMTSREDENLALAWWCDFFKNDSYSIGKARPEGSEDIIIAGLKNTEYFYHPENFKYNYYGVDLEPSFLNPDYVVAYIYNYLSNLSVTNDFSTPEFTTYYQPKNLSGTYSSSNQYSIENRCKTYTAVLTYYSGDYTGNVRYKGYVIYPCIGDYTVSIPDNYIDYDSYSTYMWIVSYCEVIDYSTFSDDTDLPERRFADYFLYSSKLKTGLIECPYGDGITNNKSLVYKDEGSFSVVGNIDDNGNITSSSTNLPNSFESDYDFGDLDFNINSLDDLFNSCDSFYDLLAKAFSILPSFIWVIIASFIVVLIFLRILGR